MTATVRPRVGRVPTEAARRPTADPFPPGGAAICEGRVFHRRLRPRVHAFDHPVDYVWIDPDRPEDLCDAHPLWSARGPAPVRFRRRDYGLTRAGSLADAARADLTPSLGRPPAGPVRMLTQLRRWGWLFNPITVYVVWDDPSRRGPVGAVLEVTNTPWNERIRYPVAFRWDGEAWCAQTDKALHVSPFLDLAHRYDVRLRSDGAHLQLDVDVVPAGDENAGPILRTGLRVVRAAPTRRTLGASARSLSTHRVSLGIHWEAARLWCKRIPIVPHPSKRPATRGDR